MNGLLLLDLAAAVFFIAGFHLAFRQKAVRRWLRMGQDRMHHAHAANQVGIDAAVDEDGVASVLRMFGVMIMAFCFTLCTLVNLIAYYSASSVN